MTFKPYNPTHPPGDSAATATLTTKLCDKCVEVAELEAEVETLGRAALLNQRYLARIDRALGLCICDHDSRHEDVCQVCAIRAALTGEGTMDRTVRYVESTTRERYENRIKRALELIGTIDGITGPAASALRKSLTATAGKPSTTE